ncbi:type II toxin-antitoxin system RelE/ParE family toxin [Alcanivorax quisquiliarum]|uniref:Type II toxin-antitoxin system RelE/ParE family toxin n=1 Tax=Alcanivorax quisquiliarum TaxID=2933565 RepID=A0ABT0EAU7_9GAMM|nr:type II toxin-antitoxin system RelE/ParE family toxin [Alcanivorax quisquiliarum]MCK0538878.1 type II toxin-antitoxin system RelE/ParE family toxin [Alcanivorax quisquiliarum]
MASLRQYETDTFRRWLSRLKDRQAKGRIVARISRLLAGLPGDVKGVGQGVSELRIDIGPGYRVYFHQQGDQWVLLLIGGDKGSQATDIKVAQKLLKAWRSEYGQDS